MVFNKPIKGVISSIENLVNNEIGHHLNRASEKADKIGEARKEITLREILVENQQNQQASQAAQAAEMVETAAKMQEGSTKLDFTRAVEVAVDNLTVAKLVSCQPMQGPVGLIYRLQHKYLEEETEKTKTEGRRMCLEVVKHAIEAGTKKLSAGMTIEAMQDVKALHGIDVEKEIMEAIGKEIAIEYNQEVIRDLEHQAHQLEATGVVTDDKELLVHIQRGANDIARKTQRGVGNWAVVSKTVGKRLTPHMETIHVDLEDDGALVRQSDLFLFAEHNGIKYYVNKWHTDEHTENKSSVLVGYKGGTEIDAGYILAPFQVIRASGVIINPLTFEPVISLMTRYGKFLAENGKDYYVKIDLEFDS